MPESRVVIRRATVADAEALSVLSAKVFPLGCPANTAPQDLAEFIAKELSAEKFRELLRDDRVLILVAETVSELAAYTMLVRGASHAQIESPEQSELRKFYVASAYHGCGVAHTLMERLLSTVEEHRESALWLSVFSGNDRAISFYKKWGFRIVGTQDFLVGTDYQKDYVMQRDATLNIGDGSR